MSRGKWAVVLAACIVLAAVAAAYAAGQAKMSAPEVIRAQRFEVVDAEGKVQAVLGLRRDGGATLDLSDAKGLKRATLTLLPDPGGPILVLSDARGEIRATLTVQQGGPSLTMRDAKGEERATLEVRRDGSPNMALRDADCKVMWEAP